MLLLAKHLAVLIMLWASLTAQAGSQEDIAAAMKAHRWLDARTRLEQVLAEHPDHALANYWAAQVYDKLDQHDLAARALAAAKAADPTERFASNTAVLRRLEARLSRPDVGDPQAPTNADESTVPWARNAPIAQPDVTAGGTGDGNANMQATQNGLSPERRARAEKHVLDTAVMVACLVGLMALAMVVWGMLTAPRLRRREQVNPGGDDQRSTVLHRDEVPSARPCVRRRPEWRSQHPTAQAQQRDGLGKTNIEPSQATLGDLAAVGTAIAFLDSMLPTAPGGSILSDTPRTQARAAAGESAALPSPGLDIGCDIDVEGSGPDMD